jgi:hypothetical protein
MPSRGTLLGLANPDAWPSRTTLLNWGVAEQVPVTEPFQDARAPSRWLSHHLDTGAVIERTDYSVGGGFVVGENDEVDAGTPISLPYPIDTGADLLRWCDETGWPIWRVVQENERRWRPDAETRAGLLHCRFSPRGSGGQRAGAGRQRGERRARPRGHGPHQRRRRRDSGRPAEPPRLPRLTPCRRGQVRVADRQVVETIRAVGAGSRPAGIRSVGDPHCRIINLDAGALPAAEHVERWGDRLLLQAADLQTIAAATAWPRDRTRSSSIAAAVYLRLPHTARLWRHPGNFVAVEHARIARSLRRLTEFTSPPAAGSAATAGSGTSSSPSPPPASRTARCPAPSRRGSRRASPR